MTTPKRTVGRPKADPSAVIRIRLPLPTHAAIMSLGGDRFVKRVLNEAVDLAIEQTKGK